MAAQLRGADTVTLRHHRGDSSTSLAQARHSSSVPTTQGVGPSQCGGRIPGRNSARILDPDSIGRRSPRIMEHFGLKRLGYRNITTDSIVVCMVT